MNFDISEVPFSRFGSYLTISILEGFKGIEDGTYIRSVHGGDNHISHIFKLETLFKGQVVAFKTIAEPSLLKLQTDFGNIEICISEEHLIRIKGNNIGIRLTMNTGSYDYLAPYENNSYEVTNYSEEIKFMLTPIYGSLYVDAPWKVKHSSVIKADFLPEEETNTFEAAIEDYISVWKHREYNESFADCKASVAASFNHWLDNMPFCKQEYKSSRELAAYITWSCVVGSRGHLTAPAMYMSKNWMTNIWSWDYCFNAMALSLWNKDLSLDQFKIFFDNQDENGAFPDFMNDRFMSYSCCKPPIQGFTLLWMLENSPLIELKDIAWMYEPLVKWTNWWLEYRDTDKDGIPGYPHGNDAGWDNSTAFNQQPPVESPDLTAFLILQMELLAKLAEFLGDTSASKEWIKRAKTTLEKLLSHSFGEGTFKSFSSGKHLVSDGDTLINFIPLILGKRLPEDVRHSLVTALFTEGRFLTDNGFATESIKSNFYQADGYWRGPIWAPSTFLIACGLDACGYENLARDTALRFITMASKNGMAENFDAISGKALRDKAFTWTSSVFLIFLNWFDED